MKDQSETSKKDKQNRKGKHSIIFVSQIILDPLMLISSKPLIILSISDFIYFILFIAIIIAVFIEILWGVVYLFWTVTDCVEKFIDSLKIKFSIKRILSSSDKEKAFFDLEKIYNSDKKIVTINAIKAFGRLRDSRAIPLLTQSTVYFKQKLNALISIGVSDDVIFNYTASQRFKKEPLEAIKYYTKNPDNRVIRFIAESIQNFSERLLALRANNATHEHLNGFLMNALKEDSHEAIRYLSGYKWEDNDIIIELLMTKTTNLSERKDALIKQGATKEQLDALNVLWLKQRKNELEGKIKNTPRMIIESKWIPEMEEVDINRSDGRYFRPEGTELVPTGREIREEYEVENWEYKALEREITDIESQLKDFNKSEN